MSRFLRLAEQQIIKARLKGQLQGFAGESKPLLERPGDAFIFPVDVKGFRIMVKA